MTIRELFLKCQSILPEDEVTIDFTDGEIVCNTYKGKVSDPAIDEYQDEDIAIFQLTGCAVYIMIYRRI